MNEIMNNSSADLFRVFLCYCFWRFYPEEEY
jgi:hypothetical protein